MLHCLFGRNLMGTTFFFVIFPDPPVSEDKSEQDLDNVVVFDSLVAMDTG